MSLQRAKEMAYSRWSSGLEELRRKPKCRDYGNGETADSLWAKLPEVSKQYWLGRTA